ncbi:glycine/betaine ABC transporter ATP-binding protein [Acidithiobacillus marinus]|uniref:Quaternary amine transport ATP-binding protein n=1 Tax=Acidithiobacillus marinus TaxID=187490 RepID=A0A2I1DNQ5_9PROT|nr:betaine/proline/choline family ABC transporter ATP-binding protein [Acidithiobacillus marinus]PKY11498.1 glycine/betaine ABC transporter ATP-binding protein [Acidithiobacillus marinus]
MIGVNNVSLSIDPGEIFVIMGLSGSGKSTVLRLINRLLEPSSGRIIIDGQDITQIGSKKLREVRRKNFGMVFQSFALIPHRTVFQNVEFGLEIQGVEKKERRARIMDVIEAVGLQGYGDLPVNQLSGGMQQRVGLARALAVDPEILLMDEAFSALDPIIRNQLQDDLLEIQERLNKTIVFVSHDLDEALKIGNHIAILRDGELIQVGTPQEILGKPADEYVSAFVQGADRSKVLKASEVMQTLRISAHPKDAPRVLLKKMERSGFNGLIVIDNSRHLLGYVDLDTARQYRDQDNIDPSVYQPLETVAPDNVVRDLIQLAHEKRTPIIVLDERQRVLGVIDKSSILAALAQGDEEDETGQASLAEPVSAADIGG